VRREGRGAVEREKEEGGRRGESWKECRD